MEGVKSLIKESFAYGFANIVSRFIGFLLMPLYTRILTPEDYGVLNVINITLMLATMLSVLGLDGATHIFYWDSERDSERKKIFSTWFWTQLLSGFFLVGILFLVSDKMSAFLFSSTEYTSLFRLSALVLVTGILPSVVINWLRVQRKPWATTWYSLLMSLITIALNIWFIAFEKSGIQGFFLAQLFSGIAMTIIGIAMMRSWLAIRFFNIGRLKAMLKYALPMIPTPVAFWILNFSGSYFIQVIDGKTEVGLYQTGATIASIMMVIVSSFTQAWGPFAMSIKSQANAKEVYAKVFILYVTVSGLLAALIGIFSPEILMLMTTKSYFDAHTVTSLLVFNSVISGLNFIAALGLNINKNMKQYSVAIFTGAFLNLALYYPVIMLWGKEGSALITLFTSIFVCAWIFYAANKVFPISYRYIESITAMSFFAGSVLVAKIFTFDNPVMNVGFKFLLFTINIIFALYLSDRYLGGYRFMFKKK